ncbi:uncharacterized protein DUF1523 [Aliiruegeria haliotis]|uniref:Uncharacterized protein DUF1523 n=1 Tax=Aliiruegeria haliotis TaxID=1280846 RepID=A0A2T0RMR8_9RHOB|nr:DUF1523 family protein [Aliiruegeria haliotis]PRY22496.1 uncharacterized protein DUF1523 [Aliiruegeria haliotis]
MWDIIKWTFWITIWVLVAAFLHYTLPQNDIVRITDTYEKRVDFGENSLFWAHPQTGETQNTVNRDVFFIQAIKPNGRPMVYRNEDTGWGWPPYFKFDTTNLQTQAADLKSTKANPQWVAMKHYGWRNEFFTIFPNAVHARPVAGPDVRIIPWTAISVLLVLGCVVLAIWSRWRKFRAKRVDPMLDDMEQGWDETSAKASRWWNSWKGPRG